MRKLIMWVLAIIVLTYLFAERIPVPAQCEGKTVCFFTY